MTEGGGQTIPPAADCRMWVISGGVDGVVRETSAAAYHTLQCNAMQCTTIQCNSGYLVQCYNAK